MGGGGGTISFIAKLPQRARAAGGKQVRSASSRLDGQHDPLVTRQWRRARVGEGEDEVESLREFNPRGGERGVWRRGLLNLDGRTAVAARFRIMNPLESQRLAIGIGGCAGVEEDLLAGSHRSAQFASHAGDGRMVCVREILHAPVEPRVEIVLEMLGPAKKRVVAVRSAVPGVALDRPVVR